MNNVASPIDRINQLQRDIAAGKDIPAEVMNEAIQQLRSERVGTGATSLKARSSKTPASLSDLIARVKGKNEPSSETP